MLHQPWCQRRLRCQQPWSHPQRCWLRWTWPSLSPQTDSNWHSPSSSGSPEAEVPDHCRLSFQGSVSDLWVVAACCSCGCEWLGISEEACPVWHQACSHLERQSLLDRNSMLDWKSRKTVWAESPEYWYDQTTAGPDSQTGGWSGRGYLISDSCLSGEFFNQKRNNNVILSSPPAWLQGVLWPPVTHLGCEIAAE